MLQNKIEEVTEMFMRDQDLHRKYDSSTKMYTQTKETFLNEDQLEKIILNNNNTNKINSMIVLPNPPYNIDKKYEVDSRIIELEKNTEAQYFKYKLEMEKLKELNERERQYRISLAKLKQEKERLDDTIRYTEEDEELVPSKIFKTIERGRSTAPERGYNIHESTLQMSSSHQEQPIIKETLKKKAKNQALVSPLISNSHMIIPVDDFNTNKKNMLPKTTSPLMQETLKANGTWYSNRVGFKLKNSVNKLTNNNNNYDERANANASTDEEIKKAKEDDDRIRKILIHLKGLVQLKKYTEAEKIVDYAFSQNLKHADLYYIAGEIKRELGQVKEAEVYLLTALKYEIHSPYTYQSLGFVYIEMEQEARAIPLLKHFVQKCISDVANFELGKCLSNQKNYVDAAHHLTKSIEINPKQPDYYLYRGETYEAMGYMKLASDDYRQYRYLKPDFARILDKKALEFEQICEFMEANKIRNFIKKINSA